MEHMTVEKVMLKLINLPMDKATNKHKKILEDSIIHLIMNRDLESED